MAYATIQDLVDAVGERELVQLTTPDGADLAGIEAARVQPVLDAVSGLMDTYLRRRYAVPAPSSPVLRACCTDLARYRLSFTGASQPTEQVRLAYKGQVAWLDAIAEGRATLDGALPAGSSMGAMVQDRERLEW